MVRFYQRESPTDNEIRLYLFLSRSLFKDDIIFLSKLKNKYETIEKKIFLNYI